MPLTGGNKTRLSREGARVFLPPVLCTGGTEGGRFSNHRTTSQKECGLY